MKIKRITALLLAAIMLICLVSCGKKAKEDTDTTAAETGAPLDTTAKTVVEDVGDGSLGIVYVYVISDAPLTDELKKDPAILAGVTYHFGEGETILDALKAVTAANEISVVESSGYVTGINGISTGDAGETSGWIFTNNGIIPEVGAANCVLSDGDTIQWIYTADYNEYFE